jgi:hypothetical protein
MPKTILKKIDEQAVIASNPKVDRDKLRQGIEALKKLEKLGIVRAGYSLETPETNKILQYVDSTIRTRRRRHG